MEVTKEMRKNAKAVVFGIVYGISNYGLSEGTSLSPKEAKRFIDKDVIIATLNDTTVGKITEICDGGIMVEEKGRIEAVNVDFIISIKEYPVDSKGKRNFFA